jgi:hypothetical protein
MRKAFDANVPKLKPRLRPGAPTAVAEPAAELPLVPAAAETVAPVATPNVNENVNETRARAVTPPPTAAPPVRPEHVEGRTGGDVMSRRERLEKIKRKVAEAARQPQGVHHRPAQTARP